MSVDTVTLFFALLAVACQVLVVGLVALWLAARRPGSARRLRVQLMERWGAEAQSLAVMVAAVATLGSLYLSEVANFPPCRLCWVQRVFMYPLAPLLFVAGRRASARLLMAGMAMATVGGLVSTWHVLIERYPSLESGATCDPTNPCSLIWVEHFGYLTIPAMALSGFAAIVALTAISLRAANTRRVRPADALPVEAGNRQEQR